MNRRDYLTDPAAELEVDWSEVWERRNPIEGDDPHWQDVADDAVWGGDTGW